MLGKNNDFMLSVISFQHYSISVIICHHLQKRKSSAAEANMATLNNSSIFMTIMLYFTLE
jgi:hypothetical protein